MIMKTKLYSVFLHPGRVAKYCDERDERVRLFICLSVCLSVCLCV